MATVHLTEKLIPTLKLEPGETCAYGSTTRSPDSVTASATPAAALGSFSTGLGAGSAGRRSARRAPSSLQEPENSPANYRHGFTWVSIRSPKKHVRIGRAAHTFECLAEKYIEYQAGNLRKNSSREVVRRLRVHARPLHRLPIDSVDQRTVADLLNKVEKGSGAPTANLVRDSMSAMFSWAMREGIALANPVANTNRRKETPRDRVLTDQELRLVWLGLPANRYGAIVSLLLLTGQRRQEIVDLQWSEIDLDRSTITLPGSRTKNGREHIIPLAGTARELLQAQPRIAGQQKVFGAMGHMSVRKAALDTRIAELNGNNPIPGWTLHDLRRSAATGMAERLGIAPHVIEAVLNHVSGFRAGIAGVYNRASYVVEKAQALTRWDEHITALVSDRQSKVTVLRGRAQQ